MGAGFQENARLRKILSTGLGRPVGRGDLSAATAVHRRGTVARQRFTGTDHAGFSVRSTRWGDAAVVSGHDVEM
ncbi:hypothetical protein CVV65_02290 [Kyrpidia spormannii]|uniref:Uncharacterized protein n=1 Tax=Kyrpidia spormannii TaxID=2055160 RepID=A0A2K8N399_9BACL|nr:hypothetical protein CVV65_02290 [Kyrpidia spormannii]